MSFDGRSLAFEHKLRYLGKSEHRLRPCRDLLLRKWCAEAEKCVQLHLWDWTETWNTSQYSHDSFFKRRAQKSDTCANEGFRVRPLHSCIISSPLIFPSCCSSEPYWYCSYCYSHGDHIAFKNNHSCERTGEVLNRCDESISIILHAINNTVTVRLKY